MVANHIYLRTPEVVSIEVVRKEPYSQNNFRCYFTPAGERSYMFQVYHLYDAQERAFVDYLRAFGFFTEKEAREVFSLLKSCSLVSKMEDAVAHIADAIPGIHQLVKNPVTGDREELYLAIMDLNDDRGWSRQDIGNWVNSLDNPPVFEEKITPKAPHITASMRRLFYTDRGKFIFNMYEDLRTDRIKHLNPYISVFKK